MKKVEDKKETADQMKIEHKKKTAKRMQEPKNQEKGTKRKRKKLN